MTGNGRTKRRVVIIGAGFAGLECAKSLAKMPELDVVVVDRRNYHLFQPLLYQVAMAGLNAADIAEPIRAVFAKYPSVTVYHGAVTRVNAAQHRIETSFGALDYDYLVFACGAVQHYFGNDEWENLAPGLKTLAQASEIRRRVLLAFERAETTTDREERSRLLTFVVVGAGPTGVELAGAIGEMCLYTLRRDFRHINLSEAKIILVSSGPLILESFAPDLSASAARSLQSLGVEIRFNARASDLSVEGLQVGGEFVPCATILWAAGVRPSPLPGKSQLPVDKAGRLLTSADLSLPRHSNIFAAGDVAHIDHKDSENNNRTLPGVAPVAMQSGSHVAKVIKADVNSQKRPDFQYFDKGSMATIGRSKAIMQSGPLKLSGLLAWVIWLLLHIAYLVRYKNRLFTIIQWGVSYFFFRRGSRLIINRRWQRHQQDL